MGAPGYARGFALTLHEDRLDPPLRRRKPTVFFTGSMADLFHDNVPDAFIERVLAVAHRTPRHTYLMLTKRAERLPGFFASRPVPNNVWLGVTVEDRRYGLPRIEHLRQVQARVRFLSVEPLLEDLGPLDLEGIHWVIVGGESGRTPARCARNGRWRCGIGAWRRGWRSASSRGAPGDRTACAATKSQRPVAGGADCGTSGRRSRGRCFERFA